MAQAMQDCDIIVMQEILKRSQFQNTNPNLIIRQSGYVSPNSLFENSGITSKAMQMGLCFFLRV